MGEYLNNFNLRHGTKEWNNMFKDLTESRTNVELKINLEGKNEKTNTTLLSLKNRIVIYTLNQKISSETA